MSEAQTITKENETEHSNAAAETVGKPSVLPSSVFYIPAHKDVKGPFQRAIGMAKGKVISVDEGSGTGVIEIDGYHYEFRDTRFEKDKQSFAIQKDQELGFAFWPTVSEAIAGQKKAGDPLTIKISNLRKKVSEPNAVEVVGWVNEIADDYFTVRLSSDRLGKTYFATLMGQYPGQVGDYVQAVGRLQEGAVRLISHHLLPNQEKSGS